MRRGTLLPIACLCALAASAPAAAQGAYPLHGHESVATADGALGTLFVKAGHPVMMARAA